MVEFEYQPWNKIIIHEMVEYPSEYFFTRATLGVPEGGQANPLTWSNGMIYRITAIQPTDDVINEQLKGVIHWSSLHYAFYPEYKSLVERERAIKVPLLNMSDHTVFGQMALWIKEQNKAK